jgi:hypothetical protein
MYDNTKILVRNAREQDIPTVIVIDAEAFASYGTAEKPETFQLRMTAFPEGFIILVAENEVAGVETAHAQGLFQKRGFQTVRNRTERGISLDVMSLDVQNTASFTLRG